MYQPLNTQNSLHSAHAVYLCVSYVTTKEISWKSSNLVDFIVEKQSVYCEDLNFYVLRT